jgi:repressor LexA
MANSKEPSNRRSLEVLPWRRGKVLQAIEDYISAHGCSPSNRDIAKAAGLKSASSALHHLEKLKAAGFISYDPRSPRTVRVLRPGRRAARPAEGPERSPAGAAPLPLGPDSPKVVWVPVVGRIAAGQPIPALESIEDRIPLPREVVGAEEGLFILKVVGDSMTGVGIFPADWVVVRQLFEDPKDGDIVAASLGGIEDEGGTVKTYKKDGRRVWLMPQNSAYTPIPGDKAEIRGKVIAVLRWLPQRVRAPGLHPVG